MKRVHVSTHLLFFTEKGYFFLHLIEVVRMLILIEDCGERIQIDVILKISKKEMM